MALATLTDLHLSGDLTAAAHRLARSIDPTLGLGDALDGLRNVALFAGLGAVWVATSTATAIRGEIRRAVIAGCLLSACVEGVQVFSPSRTASIMDLATNTLGAWLGAVGVAYLLADAARARGAKSYLGIPAFLVAGSYVGAVLCEVVTPLFSADMHWNMGGGPIAWLQIALQASLPLSFAQIPFTDFLLFAPAGFLVVMMLSERGEGGGWIRVAVVGSLLVIVAEVSHGLIRLPIRWEAVAVHVVGWSAGAWAAHRWLGSLSRALRGAERARFAFAVYAAILVLWGLRPFFPETNGAVIASQLTLGHFIPLQALAQRMDTFSVLHIAQQFFLYFPLGCFLAVWPLRLSGRWSHLWPGVFLAAVIEAGHIVVEGRFFDVTNWIIACAALGMGWLVMRRVGFRPYGAAAPKRAR